MYHSVLVPLDGSALGEYALPVALGLARQARATLHLAHVHVMPTRDLTETNDMQVRATDHMYFEGLVQRLGADWDVPLTTMLLDGPVTETLHEYALTIKAELIVMTTHGRGALSRLWLGSIADRLIRQVSVPVLLVRPQEQPLDIAHEPSISHILVPLDGSVLAETILACATALGRLTQAEYTLLQVIEPIFTAHRAAASTSIVDEQAMKIARSQAQAYLAQVASRLRSDGLRVQTATAVGSPARAILDYVRGHGVDLIALETYGQTGLAHWLLGGVADKVIRGTTVPVLLHRLQGNGERTQ
jgi:nucleotide-binding universal stress UspA family protein